MSFVDAAEIGFRYIDAHLLALDEGELEDRHGERSHVADFEEARADDARRRRTKLVLREQVGEALLFRAECGKRRFRLLDVLASCACTRFFECGFGSSRLRFSGLGCGACVVKLLQADALARFVDFQHACVDAPGVGGSGRCGAHVFLCLEDLFTARAVFQLLQDGFLCFGLCLCFLQVQCKFRRVEPCEKLTFFDGITFVHEDFREAFARTEGERDFADVDVAREPEVRCTLVLYGGFVHMIEVRAASRCEQHEREEQEFCSRLHGEWPPSFAGTMFMLSS